MTGRSRSDAALLRQAFHPGAHCIGQFGGGPEWDDLGGFITACAAAAGKAAAIAFRRIQVISVTGDTAVVRLEDDWAGMRFDDTLTLLRHDGRWQNASKLFYHKP